MAIQPKSNTAADGTTERKFKEYPQPPEGPNLARVSMLVDLGTQPSKKKDEATGEWVESKPTPKYAIYADIVDHMVDYGGEIGEKQYRIALNGSWKDIGAKTGLISGAAFTGVYSRDKEGNALKEKGVTFHANSLFSKLAKATGNKQIINPKDAVNNMDIEQLLGQSFDCIIDHNTWTNKEGKEVTQSKYTGCSPLRAGTEVAPLQAEAVAVTFDDATTGQVLMLRNDTRFTIMQAVDFEGSEIASVFEELGVDENGWITKRPTAGAPAAKAEPAPANQADDFDDFDDDIPF